MVIKTKRERERESGEQWYLGLHLVVLGGEGVEEAGHPNGAHAHLCQVLVCKGRKGVSNCAQRERERERVVYVWVCEREREVNATGRERERSEKSRRED